MFKKTWEILCKKSAKIVRLFVGEEIRLDYVENVLVKIT